MSDSVLTKVIIEGLTKTFAGSYDSILNNIDFEFTKGNFYHIEGISGSGKTTLFNIIGTLDKPSKHKNKFDRNKYKKQFEETSFFRNIIKFDYLKEQIKLFNLNEYFTDLNLNKQIINQPDQDVQKDSLINKLNSLIHPSNDELYNYFSKNSKRINIINQNKLLIREKLYGKYAKLEPLEKLKFKLLLIESIFHPTVKVDIENNNFRFDKDSIFGDNRMLLRDITTRLKSIDLYEEKKDYSLRNIKNCVRFFNKLIDYRSKILSNYYAKRKEYFIILEEDKEEFHKLTQIPYERLKDIQKERFNRLLLETIFYPMFVQSPDSIKVKYFINDKISNDEIDKLQKESEKAIYQKEITEIENRIAFYNDNQKLYFTWCFDSYTINKKLTELRKNYIRIIFQDFRLIECFSAIDNILLTKSFDESDLKSLFELIKRLFNRRMPDEVYLLLKAYEIEKKLDENELNFSRVFHAAKKTISSRKGDVLALSGGQKQLIGLIRASLSESVEGKIFLADEPTGQMDKKLKEIIYKFLLTLSKKNIVIVVSHDDIINSKEFKITINQKNFHRLVLHEGRLKEKYRSTNETKNY